MAMQRLIFGFTLHKELHMGNICENEPKLGNSQLPVVVGFCHCESRLDFASQTSHILRGKRTHLLLAIVVWPLTKQFSRKQTKAPNLSLFTSATSPKAENRMYRTEPPSNHACITQEQLETIEATIEERAIIELLILICVVLLVVRDVCTCCSKSKSPEMEPSSKDNIG